MREAVRVTVPNTAPSAREIVRFTQNGSFGTRFYDNEAINVYITTDGDSYYNSNNRHFITLLRSRYGGRIAATTMAHELGHYLGLWHTHQFTEDNLWCWREPVSRTTISDLGCILPINFPFVPLTRRCSYTGDLLCDTEADPNMGDHRYIDSLCMYDDDARDYLGVRFRPLPTNYMAYGNRSCRDSFTKDQVGAMWFTLKNTLKGKLGLWKVDAAGRSFDIYEPNNTISGAINIPVPLEVNTGRKGVSNLLTLNIPQLHSFHKDINGDVMDNTDWIPIETPPNGVLENYTITVESTIANFIEDIEVFTAGNPNGVSIEFPLPTRIFSAIPTNQTRWQISIPCDIVNNPNRLYLRVRRNQNLNEFGTYTVLGTSPSPWLNVGFGMDDAVSSLCVGGTYTGNLFNLPANTTIRWQQQFIRDNGITTPLTELVSGRNQRFVSFSISEIRGRYRLVATLTSTLTGCSMTLQREIRIGKVPVAAINVETVALNARNETCPNSSFKIRASLNTVAFPLVAFDTQEWISTNPSFVIGSPDAFGFIQVRAPNQANQSTTLIYRVTNACGTTEVRTIVHTVAQPNGRIIDCNGFNSRTELSIYPNPTKSDIKVIFKVDCQDCTTEELENLYPKINENTIVMLNDAFGNIRLQYTGKQIPVDINKNIHLNLASLPVGNYVLKVITKKDVFFAHVIKE